MIRRQPISTRSDQLVPYPTLFRSTGPSLRYQRPSTALAYWDGYPVMLLWGMASISNLGTGVSPSGQNRAAALTGADGHHTPVIGRSVASCKQADCLDRKSVVSGKRVSGRVDLGGGRVN